MGQSYLNRWLVGEEKLLSLTLFGSWLGLYNKGQINKKNFTHLGNKDPKKQLNLSISMLGLMKSGESWESTIEQRA